MSKKSHWTLEVVKSTIKEAMNDLNIDYLPTATQLRAYGIYGKILNQFGGLKGISLLMEIPLTPNRRNTKEVSQNEKIRPSRAAELEAKARKSGLHYADLQKAETLRLAGRVGT